MTAPGLETVELTGHVLAIASYHLNIDAKEEPLHLAEEILDRIGYKAGDGMAWEVIAIEQRPHQDIWAVSIRVRPAEG